MLALYTILIHATAFGLQFAQFFSPKLKQFVAGRKETYRILSEKLDPNKETVWFHCASLGEFEQGFPIMQEVKTKFPQYQLVISFFSPSGYENKKNTPIADAVVYLPLDTKKNAVKFIERLNPIVSIFVKYEIWPNYLNTLKKKNLKTILVSGVFRKDQLFFKSYGSFMRKSLSTFDHFFVQEENSEALLQSIQLNNITISGDTRFDRVSHQIEINNRLDFMDAFLGETHDLCIVCGSTWTEDEEVLLAYINKAPSSIKFVIAPHEIEAKRISEFQKKLKGKSSVLYSEFKTGSSTESSLDKTNILIVDTVGFLTKIYSYADIAYVGGAMGTSGLHNILEPATFGVPVIIGKEYSKFPEASKLRSLAGLFSVATKEECTTILNKLADNSSFRNKTGMICGHWINSNTGATKIVMQHLIDTVFPKK